MRMLKNSCVVNLIEIIQPKDNNTFTSIYVVLEYVQCDLNKLIKSSLRLDILHVKTIMFNMLQGLKFIHGCKVIHRDIKPANILVNIDCNIKICDFGLARSVSNRLDIKKPPNTSGCEDSILDDFPDFSIEEDLRRK